jgi:hypothetical protein
MAGTTITIKASCLTTGLAPRAGKTAAERRGLSRNPSMLSSIVFINHCQRQQSPQQEVVSPEGNRIQSNAGTQLYGFTGLKSA